MRKTCSRQAAGSVLVFALSASAPPALAQNIDPEVVEEELERLDKQIKDSKKHYDEASSAEAKKLINADYKMLQKIRQVVAQVSPLDESSADDSTVGELAEPDASRAGDLEMELADLDEQIRDPKRAVPPGATSEEELEVLLATLRARRTLLRTDYLKAKYGILFPWHLLRPQMKNIRLVEQRNGRSIQWDLEWDTSNLPKPASAVRGTFVIADRDGQAKWQHFHRVDKQMTPGEAFTDSGVGFKYDPLVDSHAWVRNSSTDEMTARFEVWSIQYMDGTRQDYLH